MASWLKMALIELFVRKVWSVQEEWAEGWICFDKAGLI